MLRSEDTVARVLKRFVAGGLDAIPRRTSPGREQTVTGAWEAELVWVIELDPHEVGQKTANWTTELLAEYLGQQTGIAVTHETLLADTSTHFETLSRTPDDLFRHIGSPFAPDKRPTQPQALAA